ncbi:MAG: hypothetical protein AAF697_04745 [Pseudomonadota bacterium]
MNSITLILSPLLVLQAAGQQPMAVENDAPETWTLEYPLLIQPFVEDYRRCLTGQLREVSGVADFEDQHRSDLVACKDAFDEAQESSNRILAERGEYDDYKPSDIREVFEHVGRIHIARGADLDNQFSFTIRSIEANETEFKEERERRGLVLELRDASVVKARTDATAAAAEEAYEERMEEQEGARSARD